MADVFLICSPADKVEAARLSEALQAAGLEVAGPGGSLADLATLNDVVERTPCIIVLWSAHAAADADRAHAVKLALSAWSNDRLVLAVLDDSELPAGLRDLSAFNLAADRQRTIDGIVARARELKPAAPRLPPPGMSEPAPAELTPARRAKGRRPVLVMIGILAMLILAVIGAGILFRGGGDRTTGQVPSAPAPSAPAPTPGDSAPAPAPPPPPRAETTWYAQVWPWGVIGGSALLLSIGLIVVARARMARKRTPAQDSGREGGSVAAAPEAATQPVPGPQQVFVSYSRQDAPFVDRIVEHIEGAGYTVWIDREASAHGMQRYAAPIVRAIRSSRLVALMCSRNAFASDHVVREVYVAGDFRKPFIAFQLDETQFPDDLIYFLSGFPRIPADTVEPEQLKEEIKRYVS